MPLVFNSLGDKKMGPGQRTTMRLDKKEILKYRNKMYDLEKELRKLPPTGSGIPINRINLSGSFPKEEILAMILQNPDCSHISFFTGWDAEKDLYTLMVPMKEVVAGKSASGKIIDNDNTFYSAICCQHPPLHGDSSGTKSKK